MSSEPVVTPFTVLRDTREQAPWSFRGLRASASKGGGPLIVRTGWKNLGQGMGDYTLAEAVHEDPAIRWHISIERKSVADLVSTILSGRTRFKQELANLNRMDSGHIMVEGSWSDVMNYHSPGWTENGLAAEKVHRNRQTAYWSITSWMMPDRFPRVHWHFVPCRNDAQAFAFRLLNLWWSRCRNQS
jgi:ERCC4-type nuclease